VAIVGEQLLPGRDEVCGAVYQRRAKGDRLSVWTKTAADKDAQITIGYAWLISVW